MIPRIFHFVWFDLGKGPNIPDKFMKNINNWKKKHPDAEFKFWNEDNSTELISTHYKFFLPYWNSYKNKMYLVDVVRFFFLHKYGGIYCDVDVDCVQPISTLLKQYDVILVSSSVHRFLNICSNFFMAGLAEHPIWQQCIDLCVKRHSSILHLKESATGQVFLCGPGVVNTIYNQFYSTSPQVLKLDSNNISKSSDIKSSDSDKLKSNDRNRDDSAIYLHNQEAGTWVGGKIKADILRIIAIVILFLLIIFLMIICFKKYFHPQGKKSHDMRDQSRFRRNGKIFST